MKETLIAFRNTTIKQFYKYITKPILFQQDPEKVHDRFIRIGTMLGKNAGGRLLTKATFSYQNSMLQQTIAGIQFPNPVGLAAGFDKNAHLSELLPALGFGFAELGSITGEPCAVNPQPRLWRLPDSHSIIVYYGLKNDGADAIAERLADKEFAIPIGISAAKTNCKKTVLLSAGIEDYCHVLEKFKEIGAYYTINISCPNSYGGLDFSAAERLEKLFIEMKKRKLFCKPVFLKLSPDLSLQQLDVLIALSLKYNITGLICSNLVKKKENAALHPAEKEIWVYGGVSGKPVQQHALHHVAHVYKKTKGKLVVVGSGGIFSAEDAYMYIKNGASLVQL
ncbi:MAG: quinone-dependent dihydroorotate dehydrogenase, partial [Nanoarchaeota archaeon]